MITATIHTKEYIAHWLHCRYGNPVALPRGSNFRGLFLNSLRKETYAKPAKKKLSQGVEVRINKNIQSRYGPTIAPSMECFLSDTISEQIDHELYLFITAHNDKGMSIDKAIATYKEHIGFSDKAFPLDTIRRRYYRYKNNLNKIFHSSVTKKRA